MIIGKQLRIARTKIGMTRTELARRTKTHPAKLRDLEYGSQIRGLENLLPVLSRELKVPLSFFFGSNQATENLIEIEAAKIQSSAAKILNAVT